MVKRPVITINNELCDGCGLCVPDCPEGAIQIIDGKARLISDIFCDGLGACIGRCPKGAITIEEREAEEYDEKKVMANIVKAGNNVIAAHLKHLREHGKKEYLSSSLDFLAESGIKVPEESGEVEGKVESGCALSSCPGSMNMELRKKSGGDDKEYHPSSSELGQWPIQLHLVSPGASFFTGSDLLISADCVAYSLADFHSRYLKNRTLVIACPKLDRDKDVYVEKLTGFINISKINSLTVMTMEVPCCIGLVSLVKEASSRAGRKIPLKHITVGIRGDILKEEGL